MRIDLNPIGWRRVLLVVLTLWALAMIVPGLYRLFDPLGTIGLSADNDGVVSDIISPFASAQDSPAAVAGIVPGDRIALQAMRCVPLGTPQCSSLVAILGGSGGMQSVWPHRQVTLIINPVTGGSPKTINLKAVPAPLGWAEKMVLLADTMVGTVVILVAFWLVWTRPGWMTWGLFLYVIWFNPGQSFAYYALLQRWPIVIFVQEIAEALSLGAALAGLVVFALRFPHDRTEARWQRLERRVPLIAVAMTALTLLSFANTFGYRTETISEITYLASYVIDGFVLLILLQRRRMLPPQEEQRMRWVIWGCAIGLPAYIFAEICQSTELFRHLWGVSPSQAVIGLLYLPNGVLAYFASQAVWQSRVVSVAIPLRHGTILTTLSLLVGVPIMHLHEQLSRIQEGLRLPEWIWPFVVAPAVLLILHRLHEATVELADRVFNGHFHEMRRRLENVGEAMRKVETPAEIDRLLVEGVVGTLCLSSGAVFRRVGGVFRRIQNTTGWDETSAQELHPESDVAALRSLDVGVPVRLFHEDWNRLDLPSGQDAPCLAVPVRSEIPEANAVVLFGTHEMGNDIDADEREMLGRLAVRAAAAYERVLTELLRKEVAHLRMRLAAQRPAPPTAFGNP